MVSENSKNQPLPPILTAKLFPDMQAALLDLLASLADDDWNRPTVCAGWSAKDVALHLLGDIIGHLSGRRDGFRLHTGSAGWDDLVTFINDYNDLWVRAARRMSTRVLCDQLKTASSDLCAYIQSLDMFALGTPVQWAGDNPAPVWMGIAREYTEFWMHQQHIRDAVGRPGLKERRFFHPALAAFVRALPHTYRSIDAETGALVRLVVTGEAGGEWHLVREGDSWALYAATGLIPACVVTMDAETAWRRFTRGIDHDEARQHTTLEGDISLGLPVLDMVSIIA